MGAAVGASVGVFLLFCCCGIPLCIGILVYCYNIKRRPTLQTRVVTTAPPTSGATTVVSTTQQETVTAAPMAYPTHPPPAPYPQNMYKDAQFSSGMPPPAYETAAAGYPPQVDNPLCRYSSYICTVEHLESLQWNLSNLDTNRAEESVIVSEVS